MEPDVARIYGFRQFTQGIQSCCLTLPEEGILDHVENVEAWLESENEGAEGGALARLNDGRWLTLVESQDYTGHGCQCSGSMSIWPSREEAIRMGLTEEVRLRLGLVA